MNPRIGVVAALVVIVAFSATYGPYGLAVANGQPTSTPTETPEVTTSVQNRASPGSTLTFAPPSETRTQTLMWTQTQTATQAATGVHTTAPGRTPTAAETATRTATPTAVGHSPGWYRTTDTPSDVPGAHPTVIAYSCEYVVVETPGDGVDQIEYWTSNPDYEADSDMVLVDVSGKDRVVIEPPEGREVVSVTLWDGFKGTMDGEVIAVFSLPCQQPTAPGEESR